VQLQRDRTQSAVFLVGAARSGTSLTYKALCLHPDVAFISNWVRRAPWLPELAVGNRLARAWPAARRATWFHGDNAYVYGDARPLRERVFPMPVEGEPVFERFGFRQDGAQHGSPDLDGLRRSFRRLALAAGGRTVVSKRIGHNWRITQLAAALPTARFVSITRDGRAVAYSLSRVDWWPDSVVPWYGDTPRGWAREGRDPWELCARNWVEEVRAVERGLAALTPGRVLSISYEQLVADPVTTLSTIAEFAGLGVDTDWVDDVARLRFPDRNERWRTQLEPDVVDRITGIQQADLRTYAYM